MNSDLQALAAQLAKQNFKLYVVGGTIRDLTLGKKPNDTDLLAVHPTATREDFCRIAREKLQLSIHPIGRSFPIFLLHLREEKYEVTFTNDLKHDLARRDFSVNSLALDVLNNEIVDLFGGLKDIEKMRLHPTISAKKTFEDDPVRILRAARFVAAGFTPSEELNTAADHFARDLEDATRERLKGEWHKIFQSKQTAIALRWLHKRCALDFLIPEWTACRDFQQHNPHHSDTVDEHILQVVTELDKMEAGAIVKQAGFFHDIGKPRTFSVDEHGIGHFYGHAEEGATIANSNLRHIGSSDHVRHAVCRLVELHMLPLQATTPRAARRLAMKAGDLWDDLLQLYAADRLAHVDTVPDELWAHIESLKSHAYDIKPKTFHSRDLALRGDALMALGLLPREIGMWKERLAHAVIEGLVPNEEAPLRAYFLQIRQGEHEI